MERIDRAMMDADLFVSIGTSGAVYPAAGFVRRSLSGARTLELNLEPSLAASISTIPAPDWRGCWCRVGR